MEDIIKPFLMRNSARKPRVKKEDINMKLGNGNISLSNLAHLGIVVKDAEKTTELISSIWNIGTPEVFVYSPTNELVDRRPFAGKPFTKESAGAILMSIQVVWCWNFGKSIEKCKRTYTDLRTLQHP